MDSRHVLLLMLGTAFFMAGIHHVLVWARNVPAREHLWFGLASWAAAGAALAYGITASNIHTAQLTSRMLLFFYAIWLISTTWFVIEYTAADSKRRRIAWAATLVIAVLFWGDMHPQAGGHRSFPIGTHSRLLSLDLVGAAVLTGLVIDGSLRLWFSSRRSRALMLSAGFGVVLVMVGLQEVLAHQGFQALPPLALYTFLLVVCTMVYSLAKAAADGETASQRQRLELAHASRLSVVGELTAAISHEINQPLDAILSNADAGEILLEVPDPPLDEIRRIFGDIRRDGLRASAVIRHVRRLVRKRELELEQLDANVIVAGVVALLEPDARRRRLSVSSELAPSPVALVADRALLEQALINLTLNAMDATEAAVCTDPSPVIRPPVVLGVARLADGQIEFRIVDAGVGIPAEHLRRLFDSFHTTKSHGMGLGLSISRSIIEAHGGRIQAKNNQVAGATFLLSFPLHDGH